MGSGMDFIYLSEDDGMTQAELPGGVSFLLFSVFHAILPIVVKPINKSVTFLTQAAMIAAIYVVLTMIFAPFSFGEVQVRVAEALTILPIFTPAAIPGLFVGCLIGNITGGAVLPDIIFGSIATLIGAVGTYQLRKCHRIIAVLPPILANIVIVPFVLRYAYGIVLPIPFMMLTVGIGEVISCGIMGNILAVVLGKYKGRLFVSARG